MKDFRAGTFVKTNTNYRAFQASKINHSYQFDAIELLPLLEKATLKLGELSAYSELVPDVKHFIRLHIVKEATVSSRIEGTQTKMEEAMMREEDIEPERRNDWKEVNNYILALTTAIEALENLPLSTRLIKMTHQLLMQGVRGENKLPGEFRRSQNWIGGATLADATFIPPVWTDIEELMGDFENFLHNEDTNLPHILKIALAHYQFETIHPFLDGNGRIGRLLITLYLVEKNILSQPVLYLSMFFDSNKSLYYENLMRVRLQNDIVQWFKFFLIGVIETAEKGVAGLRKIIALKEDIEQNRLTKIGSPNAVTLLRGLFGQPIIRAEDVVSMIGKSNVTAYKLITEFEQLNILKKASSGQRNRYYIFQEYFEIFE
jgi:Fic family protein